MFRMRRSRMLAAFARSTASAFAGDSTTGVGVGVAVGMGVAVGTTGVGARAGVAVGVGVRVGAGVEVGVGAGVRVDEWVGVGSVVGVGAGVSGGTGVGVGEAQATTATSSNARDKKWPEWDRIEWSIPTPRRRSRRRRCRSARRRRGADDLLRPPELQPGHRRDYRDVPGVRGPSRRPAYRGSASLAPQVSCSLQFE